MIKKLMLLAIMLATAGQLSAKTKTQIKTAPPPLQNYMALDTPNYYNPNEVLYTPKPAIWQFGDRDTTIYLFGSVHKLGYNLRWRSPLMDTLFYGATEYAFETYYADRINVDADALFDEYMPKVFHYDRPKLLDRVPAELRAELDRRTKLGYLTTPRYILNGMPSMFAISRLFPERYSSNPGGLGPGVEDVLMPEASRSGKTSYSLDDLGDATLALWAWDEKDQDALLVATLKSAMDNSLQKLTTIGNIDEGELRWATGHYAQAPLDSTGLLQVDSARKVLLHDRNSKWVVKLVERLKRTGKIFVTVGAAHLDGPDSVQSMLQEQGIKVTRIQ